MRLLNNQYLGSQKADQATLIYIDDNRLVIGRVPTATSAEKELASGQGAAGSALTGELPRRATRFVLQFGGGKNWRLMWHGMGSMAMEAGCRTRSAHGTASPLASLRLR